MSQDNPPEPQQEKTEQPDLNAPFKKAVQEKDLDTCLQLLQHTHAQSIDVNVGDERRNTALHLAIEKDHSKLVKLLLAHENIEVNRTNEYSWTPLAYAVMHRRKEIIEELLKSKNIDVNLPDKNGYAPLHKLAMKENGEQDADKQDAILDIFLKDDRLKVNQTDNVGRTALHLLPGHGLIKMIKRLVEDGRADVTLCDKENKTALDHLKDFSNNREAIIALLSPRTEKHQNLILGGSKPGNGSNTPGWVRKSLHGGTVFLATKTSVPTQQHKVRLNMSPTRCRIKAQDRSHKAIHSRQHHQLRHQVLHQVKSHRSPKAHMAQGLWSFACRRGLGLLDGALARSVF